MFQLLKMIFNLRGSLRGDIAKVTDSTDTTPIAVNGAVTVYSKVRRAAYFDNVGVWIKLAGDSPTVTITVEQSAQEVATANINAADSNYVVGDGVSPVYTALSDTNAHIKTLSIVPMKYFRFKIVGNVGNSANTTVDMRLFEQELIA